VTDDLPYRSLPTREPGGGFQLLDGIRVLDLTSSLAGPYATMLLADLGAEVVKVERPGVGDDSRSWGPPFLDGAALWFLAANRNKRSVTLDYSREPGRGILRRLIAQSDVLISTFRGSTQQRLGIDYPNARALRPDLVHASISGYGLTGPNADLTGYDLVAEGVSGVMDLTGEPDQLPQKVGTAAADLLAGMDAAYAIAAALYDRERTGRGHQIDVSLVESMSRFLTPKLMSYLGSGELQRRSGGRDSVIAIYQLFETADEPMTVALGNDAIFRRFATAIDRPELADDSRYATNADRRAHREELVALIGDLLRTKPRTHWLDLFTSATVPAGPINRVEDVAGDPHLAARSFLYAIPDGSGQPQVNTGWQLDGKANGYRLPPPDLGADTDHILTDWLGMSPEQIAELETARKEKTP
jgi:crotonobetainyl-CoA:carnitine CoA-transferase CaiB-like acyl-CoA transferase